LSQLEGFVSKFGRAFYKRQIGNEGRSVMLRKVERKVIEESWGIGKERVVPFWAGREIGWEVVNGAHEET
jgi:dihydroorotase